MKKLFNLQSSPSATERERQRLLPAPRLSSGPSVPSDWSKLPLNPVMFTARVLQTHSAERVDAFAELLPQIDCPPSGRQKTAASIAALQEKLAAIGAVIQNWENTFALSEPDRAAAQPLTPSEIQLAFGLYLSGPSSPGVINALKTLGASVNITINGATPIISHVKTLRAAPKNPLDNAVQEYYSELSQFQQFAINLQARHQLGGGLSHSEQVMNLPEFLQFLRDQF